MRHRLVRDVWPGVGSDPAGCISQVMRRGSLRLTSCSQRMRMHSRRRPTIIVSSVAALATCHVITEHAPDSSSG